MSTTNYINVFNWMGFFSSCFAEQIDLNDLQMDAALRKFQSYFRMPVNPLLYFTSVFCYR